MYIEDLLHNLHLNCKLNTWDTPIVNNFTMLTISGLGLTEKQSSLAIKILRRYSKNLGKALGIDIVPLLDNPKFKLPVRKINSFSKISIIDHDKWIKVFKVEFPYDQDKINLIRQRKDKINFSLWDNEEKAWLFAVSETSIKMLAEMIKNEKFEYDDEFKNYLDQLDTILQDIDNRVPMLSYENNRPFYKNVSPLVPKLNSTQLLPAVFEARSSGITTWDDNVSEALDAYDLDPLIKNFLSNENIQNLEIDSKKHSIHCLKDIVKYIQPILFIIPNGTELEKTSMVVNFLFDQGFTSQDMSVMFRTSNNKSKDFNEFVKTNKLNSAISSQTKFVFVSFKLPKPLVQSNIKFNGVVNLSKSSTHYRIKDFIKNTVNLINYYDFPKQMEFNFGDL